MLWSLDERRRTCWRSTTRTSRPPSRSSGTSRAPTSTPTSSSRTTLTHEWNHGLGEIVAALLDAGMELTGLVEHTSVPWEALPGQMEDIGGGEWRLDDRPERLPHSYTLQAVKRG